MIDAIEKARLAQLERCIPDIWGYQSYLYIGAGPYRHHFFERMQEKGLNVDVVEISPENCQWMISEHPWIPNVYCHDILGFVESIADKKGKIETTWDVILWSHGIEMVSKVHRGFLMLNFDVLCNKIIVNMTPFGSCGGAGNIEVWYPEEFEKFGYKTDTIGKRDQRNSNLLAWKRM